MSAKLLVELYNSWINFFQGILMWEEKGWDKQFPLSFQEMCKKEQESHEAWKLAVSRAFVA